MQNMTYYYMEGWKGDAIFLGQTYSAHNLSLLKEIPRPGTILYQMSIRKNDTVQKYVTPFSLKRAQVD